MSALERLHGASSAARPLGERLPRPKGTTTWAIAIALPALIALVSRLAGGPVPPATVLFATLLVIAIVALMGGVRPALAAVAAGLVAQESLFSFPYGPLTDHEPAQISILVVFVLLGGGIGLLVDELVRLSREQAALRRIAALVARSAAPVDLFAAVVEEVAPVLHAEAAVIAQIEPDGGATIRAVGGPVADRVAVGDRIAVEPPMVTDMVVRTQRPARADDYSKAAPWLQDHVRVLGLRSSVGAPVIVEGRLWGVIVASAQSRRLPASTEQRMSEFTEIVATAVADTETRAQLAASRARIVAASDEARRRIERDLHDGVQQRLVSLALEVRAAQAALPPGAEEPRAELTHVAEGLTAVLDELREIAGGIHPSILSNGGLVPALRAVARRAPVPVTLNIRVEHTLPDAVEVAAYYAVCEMVTNTAKHARASAMEVTVTSEGGLLQLLARDDGVGGADGAGGSGLVGMRDRIETVGGSMSLSSPTGEGTMIGVALPLGGARLRAGG